MSDCVLEVISNMVTNDAVEGIENAGSANLKIRDDWNEEAEKQNKKEEQKHKKEEKKEEA